MLKQAFTKYDYCILKMEYILMGLLTKFDFEKVDIDIPRIANSLLINLN